MLFNNFALGLKIQRHTLRGLFVFTANINKHKSSISLILFVWALLSFSRDTVLYLYIWIDSTPIVWDSSCSITDNSD